MLSHGAACTLSHVCLQVDALKAEVEEAGIASRVLPKNVQRLAEMQRTADEDAQLDVLTGKLERTLETAPVSGPGSRAYPWGSRGGLNMSEVDAVKEAIAARLQAPYGAPFKPAATSSASVFSSKFPAEAADAWAEVARVSRGGALEQPTLKPTSASISTSTFTSASGRGREAPASTDELDTRQQQLASPEQSRGASAAAMAARPPTPSPATPTVKGESRGEQEVHVATTGTNTDSSDDPFADSSWQLVVAMLGTVGVVGAMCRLRPRLGRWFVPVRVR